MLIGPHQCGKTTLVRQFVDKDRDYVTLNENTVLEAAHSDSAGFVRGFDRVSAEAVAGFPLSYIVPERDMAGLECLICGRPMMSGEELQGGTARCLAAKARSEIELRIARRELQRKEGTYGSL